MEGQGRCRLCLKYRKSKQLTSIVNHSEGSSNLTECILNIFGIKVTPDDEFPTSICHTCITLCKNFTRLRETFQKNQIILENELGANKFPAATVPVLFDTGENIPKFKMFKKVPNNHVESNNKLPKDRTFIPVVNLVPFEVSKNILNKYHKVSETSYKRICISTGDAHIDRVCDELINGLILSKSTNHSVTKIDSKKSQKYLETSTLPKTVGRRRKGFKYKENVIKNCSPLKSELIPENINTEISEFKTFSLANWNQFSNLHSLGVYTEKSANAVIFVCPTCKEELKHRDDLERHTIFHTIL